ncbi:hypothetical protein MHYP_G00128050 [Metynnis hypsauchen]
MALHGLSGGPIRFLAYDQHAMLIRLDVVFLSSQNLANKSCTLLIALLKDNSAADSSCFNLCYISPRVCQKARWMESRGS